MLDSLPSLTLEILASGIVGLIMLGVVARNAMIGWLEASRKLKQNETTVGPISTMGLAWDRDQVERALQLLERIGHGIEIQNKHSEAIAKAQGILSDNFQKTTHERLDDILKRLEETEGKSQGHRRKAKSTS